MFSDKIILAPKKNLNVHLHFIACTSFYQYNKRNQDDLQNNVPFCHLTVNTLVLHRNLVDFQNENSLHFWKLEQSAPCILIRLPVFSFITNTVLLTMIYLLNKVP